jgi:hypothetical protein
MHCTSTGSDRDVGRGLTSCLLVFRSHQKDNFETLVQPALGILMIAAVAGTFFKEDDER